MGFFRKNKKILSAFIIGLFLAGGFFVFFEDVFATTSYSIEDIGGQVGLATVDLKVLLINIIKWILGILSLVAVSLLIYGGILWMTSRGNEEKIAKAKKVIINTLIGLIIILLAWAIVLLVQRFVTNSTSPDGISCTPGEVHPSDICRECNTTGDGYVYIIPLPDGCTLPPAEFRVNDVQTAHDGDENDEEVYMCSRIQPIFNNNVEGDTVVDAIADLNNPLEIVNIDADPDEAKDGAWEVASKSITFKHPKQCTVDPANDCSDETEVSDCETGGGTCEFVLFEALTNYEVHLPNTIEDRDGLSLSWSIWSPDFCISSGDYVTCSFRTSDQNDTEPPRVTSTYPVSEGTDYPDRNVSREPIIDVNFSESIDATTVVDIANPPQPNSSNIILEQIDGQGGSVTSTVSAENLEISEKDNGFRLSLVPPYVLESFTWYRITVQNVEDLCGNALESPKVWEFQTNDLVAGFASWYPTGDNECPNVRISVTFNTTMFNNIVSFIVNGQQLIMPAPSSFGGADPDYSVTTAFGTLRIVDTISGDPSSIDPDNRFRVYELIPANPLSTDTDYLVQIDTDRVIDSEGGTLEKDWTFHVATPEDCICSPYISRLVPNEGGVGECITIQGYCFKGTEDKPADPTAVNFDLTGATIEASEDNYIVTTSPNMAVDTRADVTVNSTYQDANYGTLTSNPVEYWYRTDDLATGPCLFSVSPNYGYPGTMVSLSGIRFNPAETTRQVTFHNQDPTLIGPIFSWSDTAISSQLPATADESDDGDVNVRNDTGLSNGIPFDVQMPPPGVPIVVNYWPNCEAACINTLPGVQFSIAMNESTVNDSNITLSACADSDCAYSDLTELSVGIAYDSSARIATLEPDDYLTADSWYRVIVSENVLGSEGPGISNLNFDTDGDGTNNSFSWSFKTKDDSTLCALSSVDVSPATRTAGVGQLIGYQSYAYGSPDECNPSGQMLNSSTYDWTWSSSDINLATITNYDSDNNSLVDPWQSAETIAETTGVRIRASAEGYQDYGLLTITEDPTYCFDDSECEYNELNEYCPGSFCENNHCTAVFLESGNQFEPQDGAIGTWVSIKGCWFGNYTEGDSKVIFNDNKEGLLPDETICGTGTWTNSRILREVPNETTLLDLSDDAVTGPITVENLVGGSSYSIASDDNFTVNTVERPGICALNPSQGIEGITSVQIRGKSFGDSRETNDWVDYNETEVATYGSWADSTVWTVVPAGVGEGAAEVTLYNGTISSNPWPFTVQPPYCTVCASDNDCEDSQGCGSDGCCYDRPEVESTIPANGESDVCPNTLIEVIFDQDMDRSTLNETNISMLAGANPVDLTGRFVTSSRVVRINHDLLEPNTVYRIQLGTGITNRMGVSLADSYVYSFTTADLEGACEIDSVSIEPSVYTFYNTDPQIFEAKAYDNNDREIDRITDVYDWTWVWSSLDEAIVTVTNSDNPIQAATALKNGSTRIKATAEALTGWEGSKEGYANTDVVFCDMPWTFDDSTDCDPVVGGCIDFNFSLFYCQGNNGICEGTNTVCTNDYQATCPTDETCCPITSPVCEFSSNILPDLDLQVVRGQSGDVLKQYLFKESGRCTEGTARCNSDIDCPSGTCEVTSDGIGIRIYANPSTLSPADWYQENIENAGSPQSLTVDGYQAVRDGRTIYVGATNYYNNVLYSNIYLISYNEGASSETVNVYNRLVESWYFNTNLLNSSDKELIARDMIRISDLVKISGYLNDYRLAKVVSELPNLLQNAGFEDGTSLPDDHWTISSSTYVNLDSGEVHEGTFSAHLRGGSGSQQWVVQDIPVTMGKVYEVSVWLKAGIDSSASIYPLTQCRLADNSGFDWVYTSCNLIGDDSIDRSVSGNSGWVKRTEYVYANRSDRLLRVGCSLSSSATSSDEGWCDGFSVRETDAPYPALESGTYIVNMSTSKWPSWQATLGNALGKSLPVDPLNTLIDCPEGFSEPSACWDEVTKAFVCEPSSNIYAYQTYHGIDYTLYANLETNDQYFGADSSNSNICTSPSSCQCFDYPIYSP